MRLLVIRFSAMGDVALTVPAINRVLSDNSELEITFFSQSQFEPFFSELPQFTFWAKKPESKFELWSLILLSWYFAQKSSFDGIIDLHGSLRSRIICFFYRIFTLGKIPVNRIDKGRQEKKSAIRRKNKTHQVLISTLNRYTEVFRKSGLPKKPEFFPDEEISSRDSQWLGIRISKSLIDQYVNKVELGTKPLLGWAPFAGFPLKELPFDQQENCLRAIIREIPSSKIILFSAQRQKKQLIPWLENSFLRDHLLFSGDLCSSLKEELALISTLDLMISMDSSNMHLAALLGTKVLGLYGTTHPDLGFSPYLQRESGTMGINLSCRPCSVYGNTHCYRGDFACMRNLSEEIILNKIRQRLS